MTERYRPSNGTEGRGFIEYFCDHCERDRKYRETEDGADGCQILAASLAYDIDHPEYPSEWTYDAEGHSTCTAFTPERKPGELEPYRCDKTIDMFEGK